MHNSPQTDFTLRFNGFDLPTIPYLGFSRRLTNDEATREIISHNLVETAGRIVTGVDVGDKALVFEGWIDAPNRMMYEEALRQLRYYTEGIEKSLDFEQAGRMTRYITTRNAIQQTPIENAEGKATIRLQMLASKPYGFDLLTEKQTFTINTLVANDSLDLNMLFRGTANAQPKFRVILHSVVDGENKTISISNPLNGTVSTVAGTFVNGDIIEFDSETALATINGVKAPATGVFPEFRPNVEMALYSDTFDARNATIEVIYRRRYS